MASSNALTLSPRIAMFKESLAGMGMCSVCVSDIYPLKYDYFFLCSFIRAPKIVLPLPLTPQHHKAMTHTVAIRAVPRIDMLTLRVMSPILWRLLCWEDETGATKSHLPWP
jgi:hypothetical protein